MPLASILAAALVATSATAVLAQAPTANLQACVPAGQYNAAYDYFPVKAQNLSSSGFTVAYYPNYKVVTNIIANTTTVLYQCGTPAPANGTYPAGAKVIPVPVANATLSDVTSLTFIELLGKRTSLEFIDGVDFIVSPCIQQLNATGAVEELESANQTLQDAQFLSTSVVFGSPFGAAPEPNFVSFSATSAPSPLLRSSWINFISLFYNAEADAATVLNSINATYSCVSGAAKNASTAVATPPTLAWAQYNAPSQYNNNTASWQFNNASYKMAYTRDAGLTPLNSGAKFTSAADFQAALASVDYLIDETFLGTTTFATFLSKYNLTADSSLKIVKNKQVYRTDLLQNSGEWTSWFEAAVPLSHVVLSDIVNIAYGDSVFPSSSYSNVFLRNIAANVTAFSTAAQCTNASAPLPIGGPAKCPAVLASATPAASGTNGTTSSPAAKPGVATKAVVGPAAVVAAVVGALFVLA